MKKLIITLLSVLAVCAAAQAHTHAGYQDSSSESEVHSTKTGRTISQQTLYSSGTYYVTLPSSRGLYYLFMMTPTLYAYVTITL